MIVKKLTQEQATALYKKAVLPDPNISTKERNNARSRIVDLVQSSGVNLSSVDISSFTWRVQAAFKGLTKI